MDLGKLPPPREELLVRTHQRMTRILITHDFIHLLQVVLLHPLFTLLRLFLRRRHHFEGVRGVEESLQKVRNLGGGFVEELVGAEDQFVVPFDLLFEVKGEELGLEFVFLNLENGLFVDLQDVEIYLVAQKLVAVNEDSLVLLFLLGVHEDALSEVLHEVVVSDLNGTVQTVHQHSRVHQENVVLHQELLAVLYFHEVLFISVDEVPGKGNFGARVLHLHAGFSPQKFVLQNQTVMLGSRPLKSEEIPKGFHFILLKVKE